MLLSARKFLLGSVISLMLLPMTSFASTEFKGTETVNINKANAATLAAYLKGIGPNKAEAIVKFRKSNGSFKSAADIKKVPGVGDQTYKDIKSKISTSRGKSVAPTGYKLGESSGKSISSKKATKAKKVTDSKTKSSSSTKTKKSDSSKAKAKAKKLKTSESKGTSSSSVKKKANAAKKKSTAKKTNDSKKKKPKKKPAKKKTTKKKETSKKK